MKIKLKITLLLLVFAVGFAKAQNTVLLQHSGKATIYDGLYALNKAYASAVNGDTLYLGVGFWPGITIAKQLHIYGSGISPDSTKATGLCGILGNLVLGKGANHCHFEGFEVQGSVQVGSSDSIEYLELKRMLTGRIEFGIYGGQSRYISIDECILNAEIIGNNNVSNILVRNCILNNLISTLDNGAVIENNVFLLNSQNSSVLTSVFNAIIRNNVFAYSQSCCYGLLSGNGNVFHNNFVSIKPAFPAATDTLNNYYYPNIDSALISPGTSFSWKGNYHLKPWRVAKFKGADGTEIGIYGGRFGTVKEGWVPVIPHIQLKQINTNTDTQGKLKVNITVQAQKR